MRCELCNKKFSILKTGLCPSCYGGLEPIIYSKHLMDSEHHTFKINVLYSYSGTAKELVYRFKFLKQVDVSKIIITLILQSLDLKNNFDLIVPVPSHPIDEIKRGYSHMDVIAHKISRSSSINYEPILKRCFFPVFRRNQKLRNKKQRIFNKQRFALRPRMTTIKNKRILLLDDVMTTGATIKDCSRLLYNNGADFVEAVCFCLTRL